MKLKEAYFRNDMSALKEQQNLQEIKHLMMTQEMRRIITAQDQKVKASTDYYINVNIFFTFKKISCVSKSMLKTSDIYISHI